MDHILTAADVYPIGTGAERCHRTYWYQVHPVEPLRLPQATAAKKYAVLVTVNDGRWVIVCPDCQEGQVAAKDDPRFLCFACRNVAIEGRWRSVTWPANVQAIETELLKRPLKEQVKLPGGRIAIRGPRNWVPGESIQDLQREALDQRRASIPRLEDLDEVTARQLLAVHDDLTVSNPVVRWDDEERTIATVDWKKEHRKVRNRVD